MVATGLKWSAANAANTWLLHDLVLQSLRFWCGTQRTDILSTYFFWGGKQNKIKNLTLNEEFKSNSDVLPSITCVMNICLMQCKMFNCASVLHQSSMLNHVKSAVYNGLAHSKQWDTWICTLIQDLMDCYRVVSNHESLSSKFGIYWKIINYFKVTVTTKHKPNQGKSSYDIIW